MTGVSPRVTWVAELRVDEGPAFRVGRDGDDLVAEWSAIGTLRSDRQARNPVFTPRDGAERRAVRKCENGHAAALVRQLRGQMSLHAASVALGDGAIAFVGPSGSGKSTLAAAFCELHSAELLSDDVAAIEFRSAEKLSPRPVTWSSGPSEEEASVRFVFVAPTESEHWLDASSLAALGRSLSRGPTSKNPIAARRARLESTRLTAIVAPIFDDSLAGPTLTRLRGQWSVGTLVPCVVRFLLDDPAVTARELMQLASIVEDVPVYELRRPRHVALEEVSTWLEKRLRMGLTDEVDPEGARP